MNAHSLLRSLIPGFLAACAALCSVQAQPVLDFKRMVNNWPTIELYYTVSCGGVRQDVHDPSRFTVTEAGLPVQGFMQYCPDTTVRCPLSVALVFDASASMAGAPNAGAKAAGNAFVDSLDGVTDQAAVLWFGQDLTTQQQMTTDRGLLHDAIALLPASGNATTVWDGIYLGIQEIIARGGNSCKAVIAFTDGGDNSHAGISQNIWLANRNHIRIFTIGLGTGIQSEILRNTADLTGGRYYETADPADLVAIYADIAHRCLQGFQECMISYNAGCMDGALRPVQLTVGNLCGGSDTKSRMYKAPKDTSTFRTLRMRLGSAVVHATNEITIPVELLDTLSNEYVGNLQWTLLFPENVATFVRVTTPPGSVLQGIPISVDEMRGGMQWLQFRTASGFRGVTTQLPALMAEITLRGGDIDGRDTVCSPLGFSEGVIEAGCFRFGQEDGTLCVTPRLAGLHCAPEPLPTVAWSAAADAYVLTPARITTGIINSGDREAAAYRSSIEIDSLDFVLAGMFTKTQTGAPDKVAPSGSSVVWWEGMFRPRAKGDSVAVCFLQQFDNHDSLHCCASLWVPPAEPVVRAAGVAQFCEGDSIQLSATPGFASYLWSNGMSGRSNTVATGGLYRCRVTDAHGDTLFTPRFAVVVNPLPAAVISPPGPVRLCGTSSVRLSAGQQHAHYRWSTGETTESIVVSTPGSYTVTVTNSSGCVNTSAPVVVSTSAGPNAKISGDAQACANSTVTFRANVIAGAAYRWTAEGGDILLGQDTDALTVRLLAGPTATVRVELTDSAAQCTAFDSLTVTLLPVPKPRIAAHGSTSFCLGDSVSLDAGAGYASYSWSNGQKVRSITARAQGVYFVTVTDARGCVGASDTIAVQVSMPPNPRIAGPASPCRDTEATYSIHASAGSAISWGVTGGTIVRGGNDSTVLVRWDGTGATMLAVAVTSGTCSRGDSLLVTPGSLPSPSLTASGDTVFCEGGQVTLDAGDGYVTYLWSNGKTTRTIDITTSGLYTALVENGQGCRAQSDTISVRVNPRPPLPVITRAGNRLDVVRGTAIAQWRRDGTDLAGENGDTLAVTVSGAYTVVLTDSNGCSSESLPFVVLITAVEVLFPGTLDMEIFPEPNSGSLQLRARGIQGDRVAYGIFDCLGRALRSGSLRAAEGHANTTLDLSALPDGIYLLRMEDSAGIRTTRVTKVGRLHR
ncbi:MAG: VWA domain-containing protein [Ignavibacteria bacterium]|nr:VWA domain-containing protein [Ignavibacteria bacterium]